MTAMGGVGGRFVSCGVLLAACKSAPAELPSSDAAYVRSDASSASVAASPTSTVQGPLNTALAQSLGMQAVQERWGYHPKMATAWHMPNGNWRVTVILQEPGMTANLYYDYLGALLDGGTFGGGE
jgi:hypothetical protein